MNSLVPSASCSVINRCMSACHGNSDFPYAAPFGHSNGRCVATGKRECSSDPINVVLGMVLTPQALSNVIGLSIATG
jgi:hypothetical protein